MTSDNQTSVQSLLVVRPDLLAGLYEMEGWLEDEGVRWTLVCPSEGDIVPRRLEHDGLVVLGGEMSSLDDALCPWLEDIRALQRDAANRGRPSLGVCLGAQLMAQAFGGRTAKGEAGLETGVARVEWLAAAADDPLVADLPTPYPAGTMHGDTIVELPVGATPLGRGSVYLHQAFRIGGSSWGVQFHPEIDHEAYSWWVEAHTSPSVEDLLRLRAGSEDFLNSEEQILRANRKLVKNFVRTLSARRLDERVL